MLYKVFQVLFLYIYFFCLLLLQNIYQLSIVHLCRHLCTSSLFFYRVFSFNFFNICIVTCQIVNCCSGLRWWYQSSHERVKQTIYRNARRAAGRKREADLDDSSRASACVGVAAGIRVVDTVVGCTSSSGQLAPGLWQLPTRAHFASLILLYGRCCT